MTTKNKFYTNVKQYGNNILYVGYDDGRRIVEKVKYKPTLYTKVKNKTGIYDLFDNNLDAVSFESIKEAKEYIESYKDVSGFTIHGQSAFHYALLSDKFKDQEVVNYSQNLIRTAFLDIEVSSEHEFPEPDAAEHPITAITLYDTKEKVYNVWGLNHSPNKPYKPKKQNINYFEFNNEVDLLKHFVSYWMINTPDIVSGWNSTTFDIPYIVNRLKKLFGDKFANQLSPWKIIHEKLVASKYNLSQKDKTYDIFGVADLDYLLLYKKFTYEKLESYKLEFVANKHLGTGKINYTGDLYELYIKSFETFIDYNIRDVEILVQLNDKLKYLQLVFELTYASKCNFVDTLGTVKMWECLCNSYLANKNIFPEIHKREDVDAESYEGAFVKEPLTGKYNWITSFDATSLYPSLIRHVNIGMDTCVTDIEKYPELLQLRSNIKKTDFEYIDNKDTSVLKKHNVSMASNGQFYKRNKKSFSSELMELFFNKRKEYKNLMLENEKLYIQTKDKKYLELKETYDLRQYTVKIFLNSFYGSLANRWFQFYRTEDAEAVTLMGQTMLKFCEKNINHFMNKVCGTANKDYVVYMDTDSIYINMKYVVEKFLPNEKDKTKIIDFLDKVSKEKIQPKMDEWFNQHANYTNAYAPHIFFKREAIAEHGVWTGKKRYFLDVWDNEGTRYETPKLKVTGIETVKSSTPQVVRQKLKPCLEDILRKDNSSLIKTINEFKKDFKLLSPEEIAFPKSITDIDKYSTTQGFLKATPIHVRGSIVYNRLLVENKLLHKYQLIKNGDKIKYLYMKEPNPIFSNIIAFKDVFPQEFGLEKFIDYNLQFEKAYLDPIQNILDKIDWQLEEQLDISLWF